MQLRLRPALPLLCLGLAACANDAANVALHQKADAPLTCAAGADCDAKWTRARQWIEENSRWEIDRASDHEITVAASTGTTDVVVSAKKTPVPPAEGEPEDQAPSEYRIDFVADCQSMIGCYPTELQMKASFVDFVDNTPMPEDAGGDTDLGLGFAASRAGGAEIASVEPGSAAAMAGLKRGDRITRFNGKAVNSSAEVQGMIGAAPAGAVFPVQLLRGGKVIVVYVRA